MLGGTQESERPEHTEEGAPITGFEAPRSHVQVGEICVMPQEPKGAGITRYSVLEKFGVWQAVRNPTLQNLTNILNISQHIKDHHPS